MNMLLLKCKHCGREFESLFLMSPEQFARFPVKNDTKNFCPHCQRSAIYRKPDYYFAPPSGPEANVKTNGRPSS